MIVEVIAVGTELLLGQIVNTNAAYIGTALAEDGLDVHYQVTVGDNLDRLVDTIQRAGQRADAVVLTGGIGPTQDDLTRDALGVVLGVEIVRDEPHAAVIRQRLAERGITADTALRMADHPAGAEPLPNRNGVALGIAAIHDGTPIYAVPGVPAEMRTMIDEQVRPRLRARIGDPAVLASRVIRCWGAGEAQIAEALDELYASANPSVAFLIDGAEVIVRISAKAETGDEAAAMIAGVERRVRDELGPIVFGADGDTVESIVFALLAARDWSVATVEEATAGLVAHRLALSPHFSHGTIGRNPPVGGPTADVMVRVGPITASGTVTVTITSPEETTEGSFDAFGIDERLRHVVTTGALHLLRQALQG